ncbi:tail tube protein gp19 [Kribbella amoyensis]|uniref:Tail tube protein gp19 n=1 Tax=Kribbella amoyensis TaxID=996641 RepID=A0A561BKL6_9ACTN|nr:phage tail protein [Kribbella amoyensis]TWD79395.1 tail tube protein gp19 [Kribbella amoyensis]
MMGNGATQDTVVSAARFVADFQGTPMGTLAFSELGGINSKVGSSEYIYNDARGDTVHTKQFGKTEPPTITLKRALDAAGNTAILLWHQQARAGDPAARQDGTLSVYRSGSTEREAWYVIHKAWISEVTITAMKAGSSDVAMIECKLTCESIVPGKS